MGGRRRPGSGRAGQARRYSDGEDEGVSVGVGEGDGLGECGGLCVGGGAGEPLNGGWPTGEPENGGFGWPPPLCA